MTTLSNTNGPIAFLFPGQGSQVIGMGKELVEKYPIARQTFEEADDLLGYKLSQLCFEGPEDRLRLTEITQPAILTVSVAAWRILDQKGLKPNFVAGHSLGEYSAHVAAGTFSFADAVRTVRNRGRFMQQAVPQGQGAMAAILGLPAARINELCAQASDELTAPAPADVADPVAQAQAPKSQVVAPANLNSPDQTVISGNTAAVERAAALCKDAGAKRTVMLPVSAPFHCALMQPAQDNLMRELE